MYLSFLSEKGVIYYRRDRERARNIVSVLRNMGTTERMRSELEKMGIRYQYPKPKELIMYLIEMGTSEDDIIMDFFAGSATTAQAVIDINIKNNTNRKFIVIQLPEPIEQGEQAPEEQFSTISELAMERIRRVGKLSENAVSELVKDLGFRVFKLSSSCFAPWDGTFDGVDDKDLIDRIVDHGEHVDFSATAQDILFELLLKDGFSAYNADASITCG